MKIFIFVILLSIVYQVDSHRNNDKQDYLHELLDEDSSSTLQREKRYSSRKKTLEDIDEPEKPSRRTHLSKTSNHSNRIAQPSTTTQENYLEEASLCVNEFDVKTEQLVKVKELENGAHMIRFVRIEEPSSSHGLDIKDICMLNCCVEKYCDLAMLSEQRTNDGYKCYLFACNGSCTYAPHQDYTSMILKKDAISDDETSISSKQSSKTNDKSSDATSSTISTTCRSNEFSCRDGSCIPYYDVCNSYEDCPSGIDEAVCSPEFISHQRAQQENRKKPSVDVDLDTNTDIDENVDENVDEEPTATVKSLTKSTSTKPSKSKSKNREGNNQNKNTTSSFLYNIDLDTQERVSKLQKLKEHLEETKGPEAWYHLFQTLVQHQQQDHSNIEPEQTGSSSSGNDDDNFKDHLLALEQQWIADRQKTSTTTTTTSKPKVTTRKTTTTTTTKRMKFVNDDEPPRGRRPPPIIEDELSDDEEEDGGGGDDGDRYYWQPTYDDRRGGDRDKYPQKNRITSTTTKKPRMRYPFRDSTMTTLLRANAIESDNYSHTRSFLRESSVILLLLLGLVFTIILLVLVGFYCRDSWKRGRITKTRSTDADYLINGLYL